MSKRPSRKRLACTTALLSTVLVPSALLSNRPARAQAISQPDPGSPTLPTARSATGKRSLVAPTAKSSENVQVVGTRSRPLQHDSLPSTVFTQREIERAGIRTPQDFIRLTPGVSLIEGNDPSNSQITIRGVSQTYSLTAESPVGVIVDGVPQISPSDFNQALYDLQTIEVVKGPQNAIYGRNAIAGAVVINTLPPPQQLHASVLGGISNGGGYRTVAKVGGPIIGDIVTGSLVASEDYLDGFYKNVTTDKKIDEQNNHSVVGRVYITPNPNLTIDLKAGWVSLYGGGLAYHAQFAGNPYYNETRVDANNTSEPYVADLPNKSRTLKNNVSMRIDYQLPFGKISSVSSYNFNRDNDVAALFPYLPSPIGKADNTQNNQTTTLAYFQELKYISNKFLGLRFQAGADYYDFKRDTISNSGTTYDRTQYAGSGPYGPNSENPTSSYNNNLYKTRNWELFAETTYDITQRLILDGAIRYTRDDITDTDEAPALYTNYPGQVRGEAYSKAEPRITLTYKLNADINIFADWALGSLPGGFNPTGSTAAVHVAYPQAVLGDSYNQETSRNYEIGFNSQWFDRRLTLNGAAYYDLLTNQQFSIYYPLSGIEVLNTIDKTRIFGGELSVDVVPARGWDVSVGVGLTDAKIEAFAADPTAIGNRPPYTPDYNIVFAIDKTVKINDRLTGFARFDDSVKGTQYWEPDNVPGGRSNIVNLANVRIGVRSKDWTLTGFVRNLADYRYNESVVVLTGGIAATYLAPPRVYGAELAFGF